MDDPTLPWQDGYRLFLSHESTIKQKLHGLKLRLANYGISAFIAHEDISPTEIWQETIEDALRTMNAMAAFVTESFHQSLWTDQEIGYALCRGVTIVPVKVDGIDPYGFFGKIQALSCGWDEMAFEIAKLLINDPEMTSAYVSAVNQCQNFDHGNRLATLLDHIQALTSEQAEGLIRAFNRNREVAGSYGFNGERPTQYGIGLAEHLHRLTGKSYSYMSDNGYSKILPE